jgi:sterol desaturase/sphingolipid hydroxylase (fatty acid hydroxylase superfamily)
MWRFHAVHHSSTQLDWLSALRVHPVNDVLSKLTPAVVLAVLGFPLKMAAGYTVFLTAYTILLHANVSWSFGPLRYLIASPLFHRWHHTREHEGQETNFAPLFPLIDIVFGTFHMPAGERPSRFGTVFTSVPRTFLGQLLFPFRWSKPNRRPLPASA